MKYCKESIWTYRNKYYINEKSVSLSDNLLKTSDADFIREQLQKFKNENTYECFNKYVHLCIKANRHRLNFITFEAIDFIRKIVSSFPDEVPIVSISGGKDSTVVSDLVIKALESMSIPHIFCDTTLEDKYTHTYIERVKKIILSFLLKAVKTKNKISLKSVKTLGLQADTCVGAVPCLKQAL